LEEIMADYDDEEDFYEDDQPVEEVLAAFDRGEKGITWPPPPIVRVVQGSVNTGGVELFLGFQGGQFVTGPQINSTGGVLVGTRG
jgi:hypothetical protein